MTTIQQGRMPPGWDKVVAEDLSEEYDWIPLQATAGCHQDQRLDPLVDRGRVPRLGTHPGAGLHRWEPTGAFAPQEVRVIHAGHTPGAFAVIYAALRRALFLVPRNEFTCGCSPFCAPSPVPRSCAGRWRDGWRPPIRFWPARCSASGSPARMGLAAGFDKDGRGLEIWGALGFGYAEVGTVTAQPQPGNPEPRLFRLPEDHALLNRMGFNNEGAGALAIRLARHTPTYRSGSTSARPS